MKDPVLLAAREKIFENYRQVSNEANEVAKNIKHTREKLNNEVQVYNNLGQKQEYLSSLIKIMIEHDCDPVEAKMKYDIELENKKQTELSSMDSSASINIALTKANVTRRW